jgi:hypothetical protein
MIARVPVVPFLTLKLLPKRTELQQLFVTTLKQLFASDASSFMPVRNLVASKGWDVDRQNESSDRPTNGSEGVFVSLRNQVKSPFQ